MQLSEVQEVHVSRITAWAALLQDVTREDVRLPRLGRQLLAIRKEIIQGRGFQVPH